MKIDSYAVTSQAQRTYSKTEFQSLRATVWGGGGQITANSMNADVVDLSETAQTLTQQLQEENEQKAEQRASTQKTAGVWASGSSAPQSPAELKLQMLERFLFALTGRSMNFRLSELFSQRQQSSLRQHSISFGFAMGRGGLASYGGEISATTYTRESERVSYQAEGIVKTADGRTISLDMELSMSREFSQYTSANLKFGAEKPKLTDPLVISYGGTAASLTGEKFAFDLDSDGVQDSISFAGPGSGFLALDKNGDGVINNGSELFGPGTGNGFEELRNYDSDGNGWIDENDAVFSQLRVWSKDADGNDQLFTLLGRDVGAIYLGDVATEFSMNDAANNTMGVMRSTSFFLKESGGAGTIHHIDLSV